MDGDELLLSGYDHKKLFHNLEFDDDEHDQTNDERQQDEMLALEAIFGENVTISHMKDLRLLQIHIHHELPENFKVCAKLSDSSTSKEVSQQHEYTFGVRYLPPLVLTCLLPKSYPRSQPPRFTIASNWLDARKVSRLCGMLDDLWMEESKQEILFRWTEWLRSSSLCYLGFEFGAEIGLEEDAVDSNIIDIRAVSNIGPPESVISQMISYDREKCSEDFLVSVHQCHICFNEYAGTEFAKLPCGHIFCKKCMEAYSSLHVKEATVSKLSCPNPKCDGLVPPGLLRQLLTDEAYGRWESLMLQRTLDTMSDIVYCPRCEMACLEDEEHHAQCAKCFFSFCSLCKDRRHLGEPCMTTEEKLRILQERMTSSQLTSQQMRKEQELLNEYLSTQEALRNAKQCPSCKIAISKSGGCNKVQCRNCNQLFCYLCNKPITGYDHFNASCELFESEATERQQRWEMRVNARQITGRMRAQAHAVLHPCPVCRQLNARVENNNHISCWACQTHFCALCRKVVRRSSEHFGARGCKQHTTDSS